MAHAALSLVENCGCNNGTLSHVVVSCVVHYTLTRSPVVVSCVVPYTFTTYLDMFDLKSLTVTRSHVVVSCVVHYTFTTYGHVRYIELLIYVLLKQGFVERRVSAV